MRQPRLFVAGVHRVHLRPGRIVCRYADFGIITILIILRVWLLQSLLSAVVCMLHLMAGMALPQIFLADFGWIALLQLLVFGLFLMRLLVLVCHARCERNAYAAF